MKISMRHSRGVALALAGLLALGACGGSGDDATDPAGASASTSTEAAAPQGDTVDAGEVATRMVAAMQKAGSGTMTLETGGQTAKGDFRYVDCTLEQRTLLPVEGAEMEIIATGGFVYLKGLPGQAKPWVKVDPTATDPVSQMFKGIVDGGVSDPGRMAAHLTGTRATATANTDGTTTYAFSVDSAKAMGRTATPTPSASAATPLEITYVLGKDDRPVSISTQLAERDITVTYGDWGKKVTIEAPPADQIGSLSFPSS